MTEAATTICRSFLENPEDQTPLLLLADLLEEAGDVRGAWCRWAFNATTLAKDYETVGDSSFGRTVELAQRRPIPAQMVALAACARLIKVDERLSVMQALGRNEWMVAAAELAACGLVGCMSEEEIREILNDHGWRPWVVFWMLGKLADSEHRVHLTSLSNYGWAAGRQAGVKRQALRITHLICLSKTPDSLPTGEPLLSTDDLLAAITAA
jgi:hypothetical protein